MLRRDWRRIAEGRTADIFELDERRVLKLFKQGYSMDAARREYENHRMVSGIMAQVPRVFACAAYEGARRADDGKRAEPEPGVPDAGRADV